MSTCLAGYEAPKCTSNTGEAHHEVNARDVLPERAKCQMNRRPGSLFNAAMELVWIGNLSSENYAEMMEALLELKARDSWSSEKDGISFKETTGAAEAEEAEASFSVADTDTIDIQAPKAPFSRSLGPTGRPIVSRKENKYATIVEEQECEETGAKQRRHTTMKGEAAAKRRRQTTTEGATTTKSTQRTRICKIRREQGHNSATCEYRSEIKKAKRAGKCCSCGHIGHMKNTCFKFRVSDLETLRFRE